MNGYIKFDILNAIILNSIVTKPKTIPTLAKKNWEQVICESSTLVNSNVTTTEKQSNVQTFKSWEVTREVLDSAFLVFTRTYVLGYLVGNYGFSQWLLIVMKYKLATNFNYNAINFIKWVYTISGENQWESVMLIIELNNEINQWMRLRIVVSI